MQTADGHAPARRTAPPRAAGAERAFVRGATRDLENTIAAHLFVVCPNNSGSSFLASALAACRAVWSLPREGQGIPGYAGPVTTRDPELADLDLRRCLPVKGRYDEVLADMKARQIARLDAGQVAAFNRVFHEHRDALDYFGDELL